MKKRVDSCPRALWSVNSGSPYLLLKTARNRFNAFNVEKQTYLLIEPITLENSGGELIFFENFCNISILGTTYSVDLSPSDCNLFAAGGADKNVKIFDVRARKVVKQIAYSIFKEQITSVRWSLNGKQIAISAADGAGRIFEFGTGKSLHTLSGFGPKDRNIYL